MTDFVHYDGELFRINEEVNGIEYSANEGRTWTIRYFGNSIGRFIQLAKFGDRLLVCTTQGVFQSTTRARNWTPLYTGKLIGAFESLKEIGKKLVAKTSKGMVYSNDGGELWMPML